MLHQQLGAAIASAATPAQLDQLAGALWRGLATGLLSETEAQTLSEGIEARRTGFRAASTAAQSSFVRPTVSPTLFQRARLQQPPDRARSMERRRRLAASGPLPAQLAASFTTGELAVLRIIGDEVQECGQCARTLGEIAARAGVSRTTAQNAIRRAARLGLVTVEERRRPGRKSLPNLVKVISREWRAWLDHGPRRSQPTTGFKNPDATVKEGFSKGLRGETIPTTNLRIDSERPRVVSKRERSGNLEALLYGQRRGFQGHSG